MTTPDVASAEGTKSAKLGADKLADLLAVLTTVHNLSRRLNDQTPTVFLVRWCQNLAWQLTANLAGPVTPTTADNWMQDLSQAARALATAEGADAGYQLIFRVTEKVSAAVGASPVADVPRTPLAS